MDLQSQMTTRGRARSKEDIALPRQAVQIFALARVAGVNANQLCGELYLCQPRQLSREAADEFINGLKMRALEMVQEALAKPKPEREQTDKDCGGCANCQEWARIHGVKL